MSLGRFLSDSGKTWEEVKEDGASASSSKPLPPILNGDGKIFVSIPSFRDGERCGKTLVDLFAKASNPDKIVVGVVDQSYEEDTYCIEAYCRQMGVNNAYRRNTIRDDTTKVIAEPGKMKCPRISQIRKVAVHNMAAKGPVWARSLMRKILGNEEFCLQIDAHSQVVAGWDDLLQRQWAMTGNEFGIISTTPPPLTSLGTSEEKNVPRNCAVQFLEVGVPHFTSRGDVMVDGLTKPLLSHTWSAGFSFSKCHLEESAPYDPFTPYVMGVEQFARMARFWTRGYDVYTPTQNIVYHDYQPNPDGHGAMEWLQPTAERFRQRALQRVRTYLELPGGFPQEDFNLANLGLYGLGKRRTVQQLADFVGLDWERQGSRDPTLSCGNHKWVPYDINISPVDNLFEQPTDLDPQPEYPLRTQLTFYTEQEAAQLEALMQGDFLGTKHAAIDDSPFPSALLLLTLWIFGLFGWCVAFVPMNRGDSASTKRQRTKTAKDVKDV